ncbi:hypothetical protein AXG93_3825s1160 [Marchantia polymorpha subsp. ruderalis]|uniref:Uncharacterized protein n=1 Tax=Marchantia polymorpha subsp. ruderalis TaxID=1480154 RepID=A0A176WAY1_MARPO|nr:hypothetical protein AXG93_3825s1160 [Marchantia polymorpha subsp. ruderalis]
MEIKNAGGGGVIRAVGSDTYTRATMARSLPSDAFDQIKAEPRIYLKRAGAKDKYFAGSNAMEHEGGRTYPNGTSPATYVDKCRQTVQQQQQQQLRQELQRWHLRTEIQERRGGGGRRDRYLAGSSTSGIMSLSYIGGLTVMASTGQLTLATRRGSESWRPVMQAWIRGRLETCGKRRKMAT